MNPENNKTDYDFIDISKIFSSLWDSKIKNIPKVIYKTNIFETKVGCDLLQKFYQYGFTIVKKTPSEKNFIKNFSFCSIVWIIIHFLCKWERI